MCWALLRVLCMLINHFPKFRCLSVVFLTFTIHSFNEYLLSNYFVSSTVLSTRGRNGDKKITDKIPCPVELPLGETDQEQILWYHLYFYFI